MTLLIKIIYRCRAVSFCIRVRSLFRHSGETASTSTTDMSKTHWLTPKQSSKTTRGNDLIFGLNCPFRPEIKMLSLLGNSGRILSQALVNFCVCRQLLLPHICIIVVLMKYKNKISTYHLSGQSPYWGKQERGESRRKGKSSDRHEDLLSVLSNLQGVETI